MIEGVGYHPDFVDAEGQRILIEAVAGLLRDAPLFTPVMPRSGKRFSVCMTNAGPLGWLSDRDGGYRYQARHPVTGKCWPAIPQVVLDIWFAVGGYPHPPEACLVNYYQPEARMGLHQDRDEEEFAAPVVSISLGDTGLFRIAADRRGPSASLKLRSGDVLVMGGPARLSFHGIDRILGGSSRLLAPPLFPEGGRINLTLRRVTRP